MFNKNEESIRNCFPFWVQATWKDLPADLLGQIENYIKTPVTYNWHWMKNSMQKVCKDWRAGLNAVAPALRLGGCDLPQNLSQRFPSITILHATSTATQGRFKDLAGLPLTDITMHMDMNDITAANMAVLRGLPLTRLVLLGLDRSRTNPERVLTDAKLRAMAGLPLVKLQLSGWVPGSGYGTAAVPPRFRRISFSDAGLAPLRGMPLTTLALSAVAPLTDAGFEALRGITTLTSLELFGERGNCALSAAALRCLAAAPLITLKLSVGFLLTDAGVAALRGITTLVTLEAGGCAAVTDGGLRALAELPALATLCLSGCRCVRGVAFDPPWTASLRTLRCGGVDDVGLAAICSGLTQLRDLDVSGSVGITDNGVAQAFESEDEELDNGPFPPLDRLILKDCNRITDGGLYALRCLYGLKKLDLTNLVQITDEGLMDLTEIPLTRLEIVGCSQLTAQGVGQFWEARVKDISRYYISRY